MTLDVSDVIRFISDRIGDYNKPEYLSKWAQKATKELPSCRYALPSRESRRRRHKRKLKNISDRIGNVLKKVEKLEGFSLMEKLQLAFIFSRPVSDEFVQILKDAKFEIEQDSKKRISRFFTEDGSIVRFSDHRKIQGAKHFQGVLCVKRMSREEKRKKQKEKKEHSQQDMANEDPNSEELTEQSDESILIEPKQEESDVEVKEEPLEDNPFEQKPKQEVGEVTAEQLVKLEVDDYIDFGGDVGQGAFNGRINYEELDAQEFVYPGFPGESKPETSVRLQKRHQSSTTDNGRRPKTGEMVSAGTSSDSIATSSEQKPETGF